MALLRHGAMGRPRDARAVPAWAVAERARTRASCRGAPARSDSADRPGRAPLHPAAPGVPLPARVAVQRPAAPDRQPRRLPAAASDAERLRRERPIRCSCRSAVDPPRSASTCVTCSAACPRSPRTSSTPKLSPDPPMSRARSVGRSCRNARMPLRAGRRLAKVRTRSTRKGISEVKLSHTQAAAVAAVSSGRTSL